MGLLQALGVGMGDASDSGHLQEAFMKHCVSCFIFSVSRVAQTILAGEFLQETISNFP